MFKTVHVYQIPLEGKELQIAPQNMKQALKTLNQFLQVSTFWVLDYYTVFLDPQWSSCLRLLQSSRTISEIYPMIHRQYSLHLVIWVYQYL